MRSRHLTQPLSWFLFASAASAQQIVDNLSFGHGSQISPNGRALPGWHASGSNHHIQILSDRVILTPPVPGYARGALWSDSTAQSSDWTADLEFRASGPETGTGSLQIWYTKDKEAVAQNGIYTVGNFDGLVLVLDQYGGTGGKLRGFLNDGTKNFHLTSDLESLAFGHCDYSYRNLGRPSKIRLTHHNGLTVSVDDRECFRTDHISLPSGYYFGITGTTAHDPDSFEINKFIVSAGASAPPPPPQHPNQHTQHENSQPTLQKLDRFPGSPESVPDRAANEIKNQEEQFADLHNRLQGMTHQVANIFGEMDQLSRKMDQKHTELLANLPKFPEDGIHEIRRKMDDVDRRVQQLQRDVEGRDYGKHLNELQQAVDHVKGGLTDALPDTLNSSECISSLQSFDRVREANTLRQ